MINTTYSNRFRRVSTAVRDGMASGNYPYGQALASAQRNTAALSNGGSVIMLTSNNYLGLSVDADVVAAAEQEHESSCTAPGGFAVEAYSRSTRPDCDRGRNGIRFRGIAASQ
ncbi:hypothetical protein [Actinomyces ruminicola]|uniref:hypothetical protein n=1 Tax=Actinomyces ruminicola TaxID=332524 RepID=UPI0011CA8C6F|nr:hypothetical protein [Actinomyces ruminicola]